MARRVADRWLLAGTAALCGFLVLEAWARQPGEASSLAAASEDRSTTRSITAAYVAAGALVPLARRLPGSPVPGDRLPSAAAAAGLGLEVTGLAVRAWSMRTLGHAYSRTLRVADGQELVEVGPYRLVRHPGYLGSILAWTGFALTSRRLLGVLGVAALLGRAYAQRIGAEEAMLSERLPAYRAYQARTRRLLPGVW